MPERSAGLPHDLRVVHVASGREWRGGQRQVVLLTEGLLAHPDVHSTVITGRDTALALSLETGGVALRTPTWTIGLDPRVLIQVIRASDRATILHAHDGHSHAMADFASRITGAPVVVTRRVATPITAPSRFRRAAAVIALSEAIAREVAAVGVEPARIHRIPPGIALESPGWPSMVSEPDPDAPLIVAIAALTHEKGIDVLLEAAALLRPTHPDARWLVFGNGIEREALVAQRHRLGLDQIVDLPGHVSGPEIALKRATMAVQPSRQEGFGSSVLDALVRGVPVVASNVGGLPDALSLGGGVLVPPVDPAALAREVGALLDNAARRAELSAQGRIAGVAFGMDRLVRSTLDVYRSPDLFPGN